MSASGNGINEPLSEEARQREERLFNAEVGWRRSSKDCARMEGELDAANAEIARLRAECEWRPIETAPKGRKLIVGYRNCMGNWRTVMACYYPPDTLDSEDTKSEFADEGWYEESETHEKIMRTDEEPSHWMPLPDEPKEVER